MEYIKTITFKNILFLSVMALFFTSCTQEKTAYVNNTELIQSYQKMKDAKKEFEDRNEILSKRLDSIANNFQQQVLEYQQNFESMKQAERKQEEERLIGLRQKIEEQQRKESQALEIESQEKADELIEEVRKKVEKYGEEQDYTYIFGSNESANILYAKRGKDITLEVIEYVNQYTKSE